MNNLPAPQVFPFPPRNQVGKSWPEIAAVFQERAERERRLAWEKLAWGDVDNFHRHVTRGEALDEAAAWCRGQDQRDALPRDLRDSERT
jgi:hypothetical protein